MYKVYGILTGTVEESKVKTSKAKTVGLATLKEVKEQGVIVLVIHIRYTLYKPATYYYYFSLPSKLQC